MVRLNQHELSAAQITKLFQQLQQIVSPQSPQTTGEMLSELLGYEEQVMLAKRLACIVLLTEGYSLYKTAQMLHSRKNSYAAAARKLLAHITNIRPFPYTVF